MSIAHWLFPALSGKPLASRVTPWQAMTTLLILIAYGPVRLGMIANINLTSPGCRIRSNAGLMEG